MNLSVKHIFRPIARFYWYFPICISLLHRATSRQPRLIFKGQRSTNDNNEPFQWNYQRFIYQLLPGLGLYMESTGGTLGVNHSTAHNLCANTAIRHNLWNHACCWCWSWWWWWCLWWAQFTVWFVGLRGAYWIAPWPAYPIIIPPPSRAQSSHLFYSVFSSQASSPFPIHCG